MAASVHEWIPIINCQRISILVTIDQQRLLLEWRFHGFAIHPLYPQAETAPVVMDQRKIILIGDRQACEFVKFEPLILR